MGIDLTGARYEPTTVPNKALLGEIKGLKYVWFQKGRQSGLLQLRVQLAMAGLCDLERVAIYAIERGKTNYTQFGLKWTRRILFEWTSGCGLYQWSPLIIIACLFAIFSFVYLFPIIGAGKSCIYRVWSNDSIKIGVSSVSHERVNETWFKTHGYACYFSLISTFLVGWQDINVLDWIARIRPNEYKLKTTGWVRTVAGVHIRYYAITSLSCGY